MDVDIVRLKITEREKDFDWLRFNYLGTDTRTDIKESTKRSYNAKAISIIDKYFSVPCPPSLPNKEARILGQAAKTYLKCCTLSKLPKSTAYMLSDVMDAAGYSRLESERLIKQTSDSAQQTTVGDYTCEKTVKRSHRFSMSGNALHKIIEGVCPFPIPANANIIMEELVGPTKFRLDKLRLVVRWEEQETIGE